MNRAGKLRLIAARAIFERLAQDLEHVAGKLRQFVEKKQAVVGERDLARTRHHSPADQPGV